MTVPAAAVPLSQDQIAQDTTTRWRPIPLRAITALTALSSAWFAVGWVTLLFLLIWTAGLVVYGWMERRMSPDDKRSLVWMYFGRSLVVLVVIVLTVYLSRPRSLSGILPDWLFSNAYWPELVLLLFVIPCFTVIESNSDRTYLFTLLLSAASVCTCAFMLFALSWSRAVGITFAVIFVGILLRHMYLTMQARAEVVNLKLKAFNDPLPNQEQDFFRTLTGVLSSLEPGPETSPALALHVPTQAGWHWFNSNTGALQWIAPTPALESVLQHRRPQWAEQSVPMQSLSRKIPMANTQHGFLNPAVREGVLIPIPIGFARDGSRPRLRGIVEIPVDRQRNWLVARFWSRWRALKFPFNYRVMQLYGPAIGGLVFGLMTPQQYVRKIEFQVTPFTQPLDRLLDSWRQVKARQCLEDCIEAIRVIQIVGQDVSEVAGYLESYFDVPCLIWEGLSNNKWRLLGRSPMQPDNYSLNDLVPPLPHTTLLGQSETQITYHELAAPSPAYPTPGTHLALAVGKHAEAVIGVGIVASRQPILKPREERLLKLVVSQLALAYSNVRFRDKYKEMAKIVTEVSQLISELTRRNGSGAAVQGMHRAVARRARQLLDADSVVLYGLDPERQKVVTVWTDGDLTDLASVRDLPLHPNSVVYKVARLTIGQLFPNTLEYFYQSRRVGADGKPVFPIREQIASTFAAPLIFESKVIGVLFANYHQQQTEDSRPKDLYELFVSLATHMLAISGYHQEWAFRAADNDRRRLRRRIHNGLKWEAHTIWLDLAGITPGMVHSHSPKFANVKRSLKRAHDAARRIFDQSEQLLDLLDHAGWMDLQTKGLNTLLRDQAAFIIGDERLFSFQTNYPDRFLDIFDEKDLLDFGLEATANARNYAAGQKVQVRLEWQAELVTLVVEDEGPGLPNDKLQKMLASPHSFVTLRDTARATLKVNRRSGGGLSVSMSRKRNLEI